MLHVFRIDNHFFGQSQCSIGIYNIFLPFAGVRILIVIGAVSQRHIHLRAAGNGDINMIYCMIPVRYVRYFGCVRKENFSCIIACLVSGQSYRYAVLHDNTHIVAAAAQMVPVKSHCRLRIQMAIDSMRVTWIIKNNIISVFFRNGACFIGIQIAPIKICRLLGPVISDSLCFEIDMAVGAVPFHSPQHRVVYYDSLVVRIIFHFCQGGIIIDDIILPIVFYKRHIGFAVLNRGRIPE